MSSRRLRLETEAGDQVEYFLDVGSSGRHVETGVCQMVSDHPKEITKRERRRKRQEEL